jgi:hypothetical protein
MDMKKSSKAYIFGTLFWSLPIAFVLIVIMNLSSGEILFTSKQPANIAYHSFDPYYLHVIEQNIDWTHFPFGTHRNYSIHISRSKEISYGHYKAYSFGLSSSEATKYLQNCNVNWTNDGVTFLEPTGHKMFFPKKSFIGGR